MDDKLVGQGIVAAFLEDHKRDRRWRNIRFFVVFLSIITFLSVMLFPAMFDSFFGDEEKPYVALVRLNGMIAAGQDFSAEEVIPRIVSAFDDKDAKAVVLEINSGGGSAVQSSIIYDRLVSLKEEHPDMPLIVIGEDALASGAYLIALAADKIYVNPNTFTGSIGVISKSFGFTEVIQKIGVTRRVFTAGENKDRLDPFEPLTESDKAKLEALLSQTHTYFVDLVKNSRGDKLKGDPKELFSGDFWRGDQAVELGLVDGTGNLAGVLKRDFDVEQYRDYSLSPSFVQEIVRNMGVELNMMMRPKLMYSMG